MALDKVDIDRLKEIFVTRQECDVKNDEITKAISGIKIDLAVIKDNQQQGKWLMKTILGSVIGLVIAAIWALIGGAA